MSIDSYSQMPKTWMKLLVTGCGRSGSKYTANILRKAGLSIKHEQMGNDGTVSCPFVTYRSEVSHIKFNDYQEFGHKGGECPADFTFGEVWFQTRDPKKVIGSLRDVMFMPVKKWAEATFDQDIGTGKRGDLLWACEHWYITSYMALEICDWRYKIENIEKVWPEMLDRLDLEPRELPPTQKTMNRSQRTIKVFRKAQEVYDEITYPSWPDIRKVVNPEMYEAMRALSKELGYG